MTIEDAAVVPVGDVIRALGTSRTHAMVVSEKTPWKKHLIRFEGLLSYAIREPSLYLVGLSALCMSLAGFVLAPLFIASELFVLVWIVQAFRTRLLSNSESAKRAHAYRALVIRGGKRRLIPATQLLVGDEIVLAPGNRLPADIRFSSVDADFSVNESVLTGAKRAVKKSIDPGPVVPGLFPTIGYAGSTVTSGHALGIVLSVGAGTVLSKIEAQSDELSERDHFEARVSRFMHVASTAAGIAVSAFAVFIIAGFDTVGTHLFFYFLSIFSALAAACLPPWMGLLPYLSFSTVRTRLAKRGIVFAGFGSIEALSSVTTLCFPLIGTITKEEPTIATVYAASDKKLLSFLALAGAQTFEERLSSPLEMALRSALDQKDRAALLHFVRVAQSSVMSGRCAAVCVVEEGKKTGTVIARGSLEEVLAVTKESARSKEKILAWALQVRKLGYVVIACATRPLLASRAAVSRDLLAEPLEFSGAVALQYELRPGIRELQRTAKEMGVAAVCITDEHVVTAYALCIAAGIISSEEEVVVASESAAHSFAHSYALGTRKLFSGFSPEGAASVITALSEIGTVAYIGSRTDDRLCLAASRVPLARSRAPDVIRHSAVALFPGGGLESYLGAIAECRSAVGASSRRLFVALTGSILAAYSLIVVSAATGMLYRAEHLLLLPMFLAVPLYFGSFTATGDANAPQFFNFRSIARRAGLAGMLGATGIIVAGSLFAQYLDTSFSALMVAMAAVAGVLTGSVYFKDAIRDSRFVLAAVVSIVIVFSLLVIPAGGLAGCSFTDALPLLLVCATALLAVVMVRIGAFLSSHLSDSGNQKRLEK